MGAGKTLFLVLGIVTSASSTAWARGGGVSDSGAPTTVERPTEIAVGHELGLEDLTLRRHALGSYGTTVVAYPSPSTEAPVLRGEVLLGGGPAVQRRREALELPVGVGLSLEVHPRLDLIGDVVARAAVHPGGADEGEDTLSLDWFAWAGLAVHL